MSSGRRNKLVGQIGEFLVCAELGRLGYVATPFSGNVPDFDIIAVDESGQSLPYLPYKASEGSCSGFATGAQTSQSVLYGGYYQSRRGSKRVRVQERFLQ
ncbi:MAG: hypothetical protein RL698_98 [Pseudomonadota bacterium]